MNYAVLGVDPGVNGGLAIIGPPAGDLVLVRAFRPGMTVTDLAAELRDAVALLKKFPRHAMFLEKVGYKRGDGGKGSFTFGRVTGLLEGLALAHGMVVHRVAPVMWQANLDCLTGGNKNISKRRAQREWPALKWTHATADAALIALYGYRYLARSHAGEPQKAPLTASETGGGRSPLDEPTLAEWREKRALDLEKDDRRPERD